MPFALKTQEELVRILENEIIECRARISRCESLLDALRNPARKKSKRVLINEQIRQQVQLRMAKRMQKALEGKK